MSRLEPFKMPELPRRAAIRHAAGVYRHEEAEAPKKRRSGGPLSSTEDVVLEAVKLGYKIADEQIQKGQQIARRLRGASVRADVGDVGDLVDHGMRLAKQVAIMLAEVTETTVQGPALLREAARRSQQNEAPSGAPAPTAKRVSQESEPAEAPSVPVKVRSRRLARVELVLHRELLVKPDVYPLYSDGGQALTGVHFLQESEDNDFVLVVDVDDGQPAGDYKGIAVDPSDQRVLGHLRVTISDAGAASKTASPTPSRALAKKRKKSAGKQK